MTDSGFRPRSPASADPFAPGAAEIDPSGEEARRTFAARLPAGLRVDAQTCFLGGAASKVAKKNQARLDILERNAPVLLRTVGPDDRIKLVASAHEHIWWEAFTAGQWAALMNRCVLIITEQKVIIIRCDRKSAPVMYANQIPFTALKKVGGILASLTLTLKDGSRKFRLERSVRQEIEALIQLPSGTPTGGLEHLCPACFAPSATHVERCPSCQTEISSPATAFKRSVILPGLGSWKLGATGFGILQMIRAGILWIMTLGFAALANSEHEDGAWAAVFVLAFITLGVHVTDALAARAQAGRGLIALDARLPTSTDRQLRG